MPFGLTFNSYKAGTENNYLYNQGTGGKTHQGKEGKSFKTERQAELGWDMTKFRMYDYALGRFINVDPLADALGQESLNPYHYVRNNPINYNDPYGDCDWCLDALQTGLDVAGMIPAVGIVPDLLNAGISGARGDYVGMTLSLAAAVPLAGIVAGIVAGGAKLIKNGIKTADKINDATKIGKKVDAAASLNKNAKAANGNFVLYEVKQGDEILKVGKANADDVMADGTVRRVHTSARKARKAGHPDAKGEVVEDLGNTTTGQATDAEAARVRAHRANGNDLPLNKEKGKQYQN